MSSPGLDGKTVLLNDPMLASGRSMVLAYKALLKRGIPKKIHVVSVIASQEGVDFVKNHLPEDTTIWIGAIDKEMTKESYIVPGLGDAGDLALELKRMISWSLYIYVFFLAHVKFLFAASIAEATTNLNFTEILVSSTLGAVFCFNVFFFIAKSIFHSNSTSAWVSYFKPKKRKRTLRKEIELL